MKESVGGISLTMIVITLILLFAGIMSLTISRSNAIAVKDRVMRIVEEWDGFDMDEGSRDRTRLNTDCSGDETLCDILETINSYSYRQTGVCPEVDAGSQVLGFQRNGAVVSSGGVASFCIIRTPAGLDESGKYYYKIVMFYGIDIPVIKTLLNFKATGETKMLNN